MVLWQIALLGGVLALDATSVGQFMVSRPLVAGALAGWLLGDPSVGLVVGAILELYLLVSFPTGGARFPEGPTATVVAVASATAVTGAGAIPLGVAAGLLWGQVGGLTITALRHVNGRLAPDSTTPDTGRLTPAHLGAAGLDFVRGSLVTVMGVVAGRWGGRLVADAWPLAWDDARGLLILGAAVSCGILLRDLGGFRRRRVVFVAGLALGLMGARFL